MKLTAIISTTILAFITVASAAPTAPVDMAVGKHSKFLNHGETFPPHGDNKHEKRDVDDDDVLSQEDFNTPEKRGHWCALKNGLDEEGPMPDVLFARKYQYCNEGCQGGGNCPNPFPCGVNNFDGSKPCSKDDGSTN